MLSMRQADAAVHTYEDNTWSKLRGLLEKLSELGFRLTYQASQIGTLC